MKLYISLLVVAANLVSCGEDRSDPFKGGPIEDFLEILDVNHQPHMKLKHSALNRDFLFYGNFIPMLNSPTGHSLKGRVIQFKIATDRVIMLESALGHSISPNNESTILLADFPIISKDREGVVIDFARGMNNVFTMRNVNSSAALEKETSTQDQFKAVFLSSSFIKEIIHDDDVLVIKQVAQWRTANSELLSAEFRYFLREYLPSSTFTKKFYGKQRFVQSFSTAPMVLAPTTDAVAYMTRWDLSRPIVFHISANTPATHREAIRDGLLYWNHIFGKEIIEVKDLKEGISAPHPHLNILQWVPWDNQASAYADMVVDHLTGEIVQAQIYVRSGWIFQSIKKLKSQLEELLLTEESLPKIKAIEEGVPLPSLFDVDEPCHKSLSNYAEIVDLTANLTNGVMSDEHINLLTSDILRAVVAHEMGHVLGIRHNLAASTAGNIALKDRDTILATYLQTGEFPLDHDSYLAPSIMDVFTAADDALVGAQIRKLVGDEESSEKLAHIYDFDKQAVDFIYFDQPMKGTIPFCTDEDTARFLDCKRWDISNTSLLFASSRINIMLNQVASILADTFIASIDPDRKGGPLKLTDTPLTTTGLFKIIDTYVKDLFSWFAANARSAQIETRFHAFGPHNEAAIRRARFDEVKKELAVDGLEQTLFALVPPFRKANLESSHITKLFSMHFKKRLEHLKKTRKGFSIPPDIEAEARNIALSFFTKLGDDIVVAIIRVLAKAQFDDPSYQTPVETALGKIARELILSADSDDWYKLEELPRFTYDLTTREAAVLLLNPGLGLLADWSFDSLARIHHDLKTLVEEKLGQRPISFDTIATAPRHKRQWFMEQNRIMNALMRTKSLGRKLNPL